MNIKTIVNEKKRGCGYRKPGGLYLMAGETLSQCGKLPLELTVCPCCHAGIKPARGWTWIDPRPLFAEKECALRHGAGGCLCILDRSNLPEKCGLLWIGEKFYPTPAEFLKEAETQGVSRRLTAIPKDFVIGKTWVAFAHRKGFSRVAEYDADGSPVLGSDYKPVMEDVQAIVGFFKPTRIEYVVKDDDDPEKLQRLEDRGITLVNLEWDEGAREDEEPDAEYQQDLILEDQERADFAQDRDEDNISAADIL